MKEKGGYTLPFIPSPIGYNVNRYVESLHLNIERDFKHLISYIYIYEYRI